MRRLNLFSAQSEFFLKKKLASWVGFPELAAAIVSVCTAQSAAMEAEERPIFLELGLESFIKNGDYI
jgi:hypothetical protein